MTIEDRVRRAMEARADLVPTRAAPALRVEETHRDDPSGPKRLVAGTVAFVVFALAAVFGWQALRPGDRDPIGPPATSATIKLASTDQGPSATLSYDGAEQSGVFERSVWCIAKSGECTSGTGESAYPPIDESLAIPVGTPLAFEGEGRVERFVVRTTEGDRSSPNAIVDTDGSSASVPTEPGDYLLWVAADWEQGSGSFYLRVRATAGPDSSPPEPTGAIAFIDGNQAFGPIAVLDPASGTTERLTGKSFSSVSLTWSPGGSLIAVTNAVLEGNGEIVLVSTETGEIVRTMPIETNLHPQDLAWSPDGRSLAFTSTVQRLYMIDADGSNLRSISTDDRRALGIGFSPTGDEIAFVGDRGDLGVVNLVSGETRLLVADRGIGYSPTWSPDGTRIAFSTDGPEGMSINVVDADGSNETILVDDSVYATDPSWSPDGNWISFERIGEDRNNLFAASVVDGSLRQLTDSPSDEPASDWGSPPSEGDEPGSIPTATVVSDYDSFVAALSSAGVSTTEREGKWFQRFFGEPLHRLNVGGALYVHEFPTTDALEEFRRKVSGTDGSQIPSRDGNGVVIIDWGTPRMYANGKVLAIYFGNERATRDTLEELLGPTFTGPEVAGF